MLKTTVTIGTINGKHAVLKEPSEDADAHIAFIRDLTNAGGIITAGKTEKKVEEAIVLHSARGLMRRRHFA
jgi:hypothetical protein